MSINLVGDANNTAGRASTSIASLERLLVSTLAKIIGAGVDNNSTLYNKLACNFLFQQDSIDLFIWICGLTYANNRLRANQLDVLVLDRALGVTLGISSDVAKVTNVAVLVGGSTVGLVVGVDWSKEEGISWLKWNVAHFKVKASWDLQ